MCQRGEIGVREKEYGERVREERRKDEQKGGTEGSTRKEGMCRGELRQARGGGRRDAGGKGYERHGETEQ